MISPRVNTLFSFDLVEIKTTQPNLDFSKNIQLTSFDFFQAILLWFVEID